MAVELTPVHITREMLKAKLRYEQDEIGSFRERGSMRPKRVIGWLLAGAAACACGRIGYDPLQSDGLSIDGPSDATARGGKDGGRQSSGLGSEGGRSAGSMDGPGPALGGAFAAGGRTSADASALHRDGGTSGGVSASDAALDGPAVGGAAGAATGGAPNGGGGETSGAGGASSCVSKGSPCNTMKVQCATPTADKPGDAWLRPRVDLLNLGSADAPLNELTVRYWYTPDGSSTPTFACDFAAIGCVNIVVTFEAVAPPRAGASEVAVVTFLPAAGSVAPSGHTDLIGLRIGNADFTDFDETNDYSYSGGGASLVDDPHITLYRNGRLISGAEPPL